VSSSVEAVRAAVVLDGVALVEYVRGEGRLYAYVLAADRLRRLDLGELGPIDVSVRAFVQAVASPPDAGPATVSSIRRLGTDLFGRLLAPAISAAGEGIETLVIVPDSFVARIPFEALVVESVANGNEERFSDLVFVLDRYSVVYGPSCPVIRELAETGRRGDEGKILVLADPEYPSERGGSGPPVAMETRARRPSEAFERVEKTRIEALSVARLFATIEDLEIPAALDAFESGAARHGTVSARRFDLHLGADASPARLRRDLRGYSILHFAAHGFVDDERPERSGLALAFGEADDGYVSIADVLDLDLDADLVVLSACETARGEAVVGEGVQSLARAFLFAGSRSVVASLWPVADWAAAETMVSFYRGASDGRLRPADALRRAKLEIRRATGRRGPAGALLGVGRVASRPVDPEAGVASVESPRIGARDATEPTGPSIEPGHPFYWAPFVYVGLP
jgi:CHAT domain-containing protein